MKKSKKKEIDMRIRVLRRKLTELSERRDKKIEGVPRKPFKRKKRGVKLTCQHCDYEWSYRGYSKFYATCPNCQFKVHIKKSKKKR